MVEYEIELSVIAIFRIMQIIDETCKGQGKSRDYEVAAGLYEKIEITEEERARKFQFKDKDGNDQVNPRAIKEAPNQRFILDYREIEKLEKVLVDYPKIAPSERRLWYNYVMQQLENARKPGLDDEETKTRRLAEIGKNSQKGVSSS